MKRSGKVSRPYSVRAGVTLPAELKAAMEAVPVRVNWSSIAARAFRQELERLQNGRSEPLTMEYLLARLELLEARLEGPVKVAKTRSSNGA
jgi:hypothetical protein